MKKISVLAVSVFACLLMSGCVVGRRTVALTVPSAPSMAKPARGNIVLKSVVDNRKFENNPSEPSTPSIDGDVNKLNVEQRKAFIGRQRNGFGRAMGDIALPAGETVETQTFNLVREALVNRGYAVTSQGEGKDSVEVSIDEFWAWFTPGFATISFESRITCKLTIRHGDQVQTLTVTGHGLNVGQVASNANWALAYTRGFDDFLPKLDAELAKAGL